MSNREQKILTYLPNRDNMYIEKGVTDRRLAQLND